MNGLYNLKSCFARIRRKKETDKKEWEKYMKIPNSHQFFQNTECKYFPCHASMAGEAFNCLFCYCPMNPYADCPGTPRYIHKENGAVIKDCTECTFPHRPENYEKVIAFLKEKLQTAGGADVQSCRDRI